MIEGNRMKKEDGVELNWVILMYQNFLRLISVAAQHSAQLFCFILLLVCSLRNQSMSLVLEFPLIGD